MMKKITISLDEYRCLLRIIDSTGVLWKVVNKGLDPTQSMIITRRHLMDWVNKYAPKPKIITPHHKSQSGDLSGDLSQSGDLENLVETAFKAADEIIERAQKNVDKWGKQDLDTLGLAIAEETGELCQAILQSRESNTEDRIRQEAIDLGALCHQVIFILAQRSTGS